MSYRRILVAIRDASAQHRSTLRKVATLARASGSSVELFHAIADPIALEALHLAAAGAPPSHSGAEIGRRLSARLDRLARSQIFDGLTVRTHIEWDYPAHEAIVRRALAVRPDLVVAETRAHRFGSRFLLVNTDWELIRACPCPLLLVKSTAAYERAAVLAAVDPLHINDKPATLDRRLLEAGRTMAALLGGPLHAFHAYLPLAAVPVSFGANALITLSPQVQQRYAKHVRRAFDALMGRAAVPRPRRHLCVGDVTSQLEDTVRRAHARIVVMGAVSRSGLKRLFVGSTAEQVLDRLRCDVLIVKPRGFTTRVAARRPR